MASEGDIEEDFRFMGLKSTPLPKLSEVKSRYRKLALKHHPDKGFKKQAFQNLFNCYIRVSTFVAKHKTECERSAEDEEEKLLSELFQRFDILT